MRAILEGGAPDECLGEETLLSFLDGRSPEPDRARVGRHVAHCALCRKVLSALASQGDSHSEEAQPSPEGAGRGAWLGQTTLPTPGGRGASGPPRGAEGVRAPGPHAESEPGARGDAEGLGPGERVGRYLVLARVGLGGMGIVYAAYDPELNRKVALKLLRPEPTDRRPHRPLEERLRREAQAMARLAHPNVAAVHDVGQYEGRVFVAMEFVEGETLARWLEREKRPPLRAVLERYEAAGRGLAAAHAAGLVHRDFKPQNVLVGDDGRVRVVDFGLARLSGGDEGEAEVDGVPSGHGARAPGLTATGALLGTPSYMAPEQLRGEAADAKSDQFSFCVALYEALYGERPFAGDTLGALRAEVAAGRVRSEPKGARVPGRVRRVLLRGLSASPSERYPSMGALLDALVHDPRRRLRLMAMGGALALTTAAAGAIAAGRFGDRWLLCRGSERRLEQVWNGPRRQALEAAFARTGMPYAAAASREVGRALDAYAAQWALQHVEACEATRVRGEQTEELMGLRMACLDERRSELKALTDRLVEADREVTEKAVQAAHRLSGLENCADLRALTGPLRPPPDATTRAEVEALRARLAEARALLHAGLYPRGLDQARPIVERAGQLRYRPLEAEALFVLGQLSDEGGEVAAAAQALQQAAWAANAGRHDEVEVRALSRLIRLEGSRQERFDQIEPLERQARAALERAGGGGELEAELLLALGRVNVVLGRYAEAGPPLSQALSMLERRHGPDDLRLSETLSMLGYLELQRRKTPEARAHFERNLAILRRSFGDEHPRVASTLEDIAGAQYQASEYELSEATHKQALAAFERALGPDNAKVADVLHNLALVYYEQNRLAEAGALSRRAVAVAEKTLGPEHPATAIYLGPLADALEAEGKPAEALAVLDRVLSLLRRRYGDEHPRVAETLLTLGRLQADLGRLSEARETVLKSHAIYQRALGENYPAGDVMRALGDIYLRLRKPALAVGPLETARRTLLERGEGPSAAALATALLARALFESGQDRGRARVLAREAYGLMKAEEHPAKELVQFERWGQKAGLL